MSNEDFTKTIRELKDELRKAIYTYIAFWTINMIAFLILVARIARLW